MTTPSNNQQIFHKDFGEQVIQTPVNFDPSMQIISEQTPQVVSIESAYNEGSRTKPNF